MRKAGVFWKDVRAGILEETDRGFLFSYDEAYLKNPKSRAISLNLPLRKESYESGSFFPFFDGMIPEGWYLDIVSKTLKVAPEDRLGLLLATSSHAIGSVTVRALDKEGAS